jgi:hypothetical protein
MTARVLDEERKRLKEIMIANGLNIYSSRFSLATDDDSF